MIATLLLLVRIAIALFLFAFLGWALLVLWNDFQREAKSISDRMFSPVTISIASPDGMREVQFDFPVILIGRDSRCDLHLDDTTVSAEHARLTYHHSQWWVEDLGSKNGTYLNHVPVINATVLKSGDELELGKATLVIRFSERN